MKYKIYRTQSNKEWIVTLEGGIVVETTHPSKYWMTGWGWRELVAWCHRSKYTIRPIKRRITYAE